MLLRIRFELLYSLSIHTLFFFYFCVLHSNGWIVGFDKTDRYALFAEYFLYRCFFNVWMVFPLKKHLFHVIRYGDKAKIKIKPYTTRLRWRVLRYNRNLWHAISKAPVYLHFKPKIGYNNSKCAANIGFGKLALNRFRRVFSSEIAHFPQVVVWFFNFNASLMNKL